MEYIVCGLEPLPSNLGGRLNRVYQLDRICFDDAAFDEETIKAMTDQAFSIVCLDDKKLVAALTGRPYLGDRELCFYINSIAVHPDHEHKGIGSTLLNLLETYLAAYGIFHIYIHHVSDPRLFYFYEEKNGYIKSDAGDLAYHKILKRMR